MQMPTIDIEIAYAQPGKQSLISIQVQDTATVDDILQLDEVRKIVPITELQRAIVGIWGRVVQRDRRVRPGDRVEIYRSLNMDPREARRQLAASGLTMKDAHGD